MLLRRILSPYVEVPSDSSGARLTLDGPSVPLGARAVTTFALILHELATNAAKYGALSVEEGSLRITWACVDNVLILKWEERGGPALSGPPKSERVRDRDFQSQCPRAVRRHALPRMGFERSLGGTLRSDGTIKPLRRWSNRRGHSKREHHAWAAGRGKLLSPLRRAGFRCGANDIISSTFTHSSQTFRCVSGVPHWRAGLWHG